MRSVMELAGIDPDLQGMDLVDVAGLVVMGYSGGAKALAPRIGKSGTSLSHELNPPDGSTAKLGLRTAQQITEKTQDKRIPIAFALNSGLMVLPLPNLDGVLPGSIIANAGRVLAEAGDVVQAVGHALEGDGKVTDNELAVFTRQVSELMAALPHLFAAMEENNRRHGGGGMAMAVQAQLRAVA